MKALKWIAGLFLVTALYSISTRIMGNSVENLALMAFKAKGYSTSERYTIDGVTFDSTVKLEYNMQKSNEALRRFKDTQISSLQIYSGIAPGNTFMQLVHAIYGQNVTVNIDADLKNNLASYIKVTGDPTLKYSIMTIDVDSFAAKRMSCFLRNSNPPMYVESVYLTKPGEQWTFTFSRPTEDISIFMTNFLKTVRYARPS